MNSFMSDSEISSLGLRSYGEKVLISKNASIYSPELISIGNNVRIDDFCILSGDIKIGSHIHISAGVYIYGGGRIVINDFSGISAKCCLYSVTDDFGGGYFTNTQLPDHLRNVLHAPVIIGKFVQIGSSSIVLPGVTINDGVAVGAMSLITKDLDSWGIYAGIPAKRIKERRKDLIDLEKIYFGE